MASMATSGGMDIRFLNHLLEAAKGELAKPALTEARVRRLLEYAQKDPHLQTKIHDAFMALKKAEKDIKEAEALAKHGHDDNMAGALHHLFVQIFAVETLFPETAR